MLTFTRHRIAATDVDAFIVDAKSAVEPLAARPGCRWVTVARAIDDPGLMVIASEWDDVGSYRRALSSFEVKVGTVPLLSTAIDEATAFEVLHRNGPEGSVDFDTAVNTGEWSLGRPADTVVDE